MHKKFILDILWKNKNPQSYQQLIFILKITIKKNNHSYKAFILMQIKLIAIKNLRNKQ